MNATVAASGEEPTMPDELRPRHLWVRVAQLAAVIGVTVIAIGALPGFDEVRRRLEHADAAAVVLLVLAELGSCAGYLLAFRETFCSQMSWRLSYDIAMAELAANSLLPAGGAGGLALGVWALRQAGLPTGHIARRTVAFFIVTSAANFVSVAAFGIAVFVGLIPGGGTWALTLVPGLLALLACGLVFLSPRLRRRRHAPAEEGLTGTLRAKVRAALTTVSDGVEQAVALLGSHSLGLVVGSFAYMAFDIAALGFGFAAVGPVPAVGTLALGYLLGQLGNLVPLPGGIGGTEGGLIAVFALYGFKVPEAAAAVLAYRLFQLMVPALLGAPAFVLLRRNLRQTDRPGLVCAPLGLDVVRLPARG